MINKVVGSSLVWSPCSWMSEDWTLYCQRWLSSRREVSWLRIKHSVVVVIVVVVVTYNKQPDDLLSLCIHLPQGRTSYHTSYNIFIHYIFVQENNCPRKHLSKKTFVQGHYCCCQRWLCSSRTIVQVSIRMSKNNMQCKENIKNCILKKSVFFLFENATFSDNAVSTKS